MMTIYALSKFLYMQERMGIVAIFHMLHPRLIYMNIETWGKIVAGEDIPENLFKALRLEQLFVEPGEDEIVLREAQAKAAHRLSRPTILYLMLAQDCNNACVYCPVPAQALRYGKRLLAYEDAVAGIALWQQHIKRHLDGDPYYLMLYGGEPLLNRNVLQQVIERVRENRDDLPEKTNIIVPTNGRLLDTSLAKFFREHKVHVALGIDGPPSIHDQLRLSDSLSATSVEVIRALRLLQNESVAVSASVTLTPHSVLRADEIRGYLRSIGVTSFGFNILKGPALLESLETMTSREYYLAAAQAVVGGLAVTDMTEYQLQKKLRALTEGESFGLDCTCYGNQVVVQADGVVTNCPFLRYEMGSVRSLSILFDISSSEAVQRWRRRLPIFSAGWCLSQDKSLPHGGGCTWGAENPSDDLWVIDDGNAIYNSEVIHELIWRLLPSGVAEQLAGGRINRWDYRRDGSN